jgi:hypothetical protein
MLGDVGLKVLCGRGRSGDFGGRAQFGDVGDITFLLHVSIHIKKNI